ncbi:MAG TPA: hypothetical protein VJO54_15980 [Burkholderiales bacterium]|nr:hypothetical protein [Burkholderiales bacterium]
MLRAMQSLLAGIYDVPLVHDVAEFVLTDRGRVPPARGDNGADEQVLVAQEGDTLWIGVYLEPGVLRRLTSENPFDALHGGNIADTLTALEGVSHFVRLAWSAAHGRPVTLLELELQGEIDKYVGTLWLLREQHPERFPVELHHVLFERARVDSVLAGERIALYRRANAYAARFCRRLARGLIRAGSAPHAAAVAELRRFYRMNRERKFHHIERAA